MNLYTIGFTKKTAEQFFETLKNNGIKKLIDIRLNNKSQLAGFTKSENLKYFLHKLYGIEYSYMKEFAPTKQILNDYKKKKINWDNYTQQYNELLKKRNIEITPEFFKDACLLCSEDEADKCHRRLAAEYIAGKVRGIKIIHL
ncbi:MAG: DUF488 domain-containing protein [Candidatus Goldbacteria bacterium]|nr:DUF488 domain-containing protein [Candidatus Goldiibacteriota bacterium]